MRKSLQDIYGRKMLFDYGDKPLSQYAFHSRKRNIRKKWAEIRKNHLIAKYDIIFGHFVADKYDFIGPQNKYCAFFRDPVDRVCSHYFFWKKRMGRYISSREELVAGWGLPAKIVHLPRQLSNYGKYKIKIFHSMWAEMYKHKSSLLEFARLNNQKCLYALFLGKIQIKHLDFVGITEAYEESVELYQKIFGTKLEVVKMNVGNHQDYQTMLKDRGIFKEIHAAQTINQHIYDTARRRFEQLCKIYK